VVKVGDVATDSLRRRPVAQDQRSKRFPRSRFLTAEELLKEVLVRGVLDTERRLSPDEPLG
jgi:hypothetical protein